ncbi:MAG: methyltransferase domain-containing protein [Planctomycetes bacterium]|nr:methyltransferase domain-containing protein [Planctomycetota bacterium]
MRSPLEPTSELETIFELENVPVFCNVLYDDVEAARSATRGTLRLGLCTATGFVFNQAFDPSLVAYSPIYENSQVFSPRFAAYQESLASALADGLTDHDLVVEVGCGQADFLRELVRHGPFRAVGFDRSLTGSTSEPTEGGGTLDLRNEFLDTASCTLAPKLVINRHVLEHVEDPLALLRGFRELIAKNPAGRLYLEVPNAEHSFRGGIWDLIYEHCGYFTEASLLEALGRAGFEVLELRRAFDEQFLCAIARPRTTDAALVFADKTSVEVAITAARALDSVFAATLQSANDTLDRELGTSHATKRVVIQGAGSKGVMLLNVLDRGSEILAAVDKNPRKTNRYIAGTGHVIVAPSALPELHPDVVLVANPAYLTEVERECRALGVDARVVAI